MVYGVLRYGEECVYGGDVPCDIPPAPDAAHCDLCGEGWRVEATDLVTGVVKAVLHPVNVQWEEHYSRPGTGSLTASIVGPSASDVWPHTTGLYVSRVLTDGTRVGHFGGYIEALAPNPDNWTLFNLGLQSLDNYLFHRLLADDDEGLAYATPVDGTPHTQVALDLLNIAVSGKGAIPLSGVAGPSTNLSIQAWNPWDFKNIGDAIAELVDAGLTYRLTHTFVDNPARWSTTITFDDELNIDNGVALRGGLEGWRYALTLDAKDQASRIYGVGAGTGVSQMFSIAYDQDAPLPEFQATMAWKDVTVPATLDTNTVGAVTNYRDPATTPSLTLVGLTDVPPETVQTGDIISPDIGFGVATFRDEKARVVSQAWQLQVDEPVTRTLGLEPVIRPSLSVKTQVPAVATVPTDTSSAPPQTPIAVPVKTGLVTTINVSSLNEVSGMQYVDGNVWVTNDENNSPQVIVVSLANGSQAGSHSVGSPSRKDPEAIRRHPNGTVWLGDIGDNDSERSSVRLYQVGGSASVSIRYPFGPANAEALLIHPTSGEFFIATKDARMVGFGTGPSSTGTQVAAPGLPSGISDGTFTNDGKFALFTIAGSSSVYVHSYPGFAAVGTIPIPSMSKCEAITMDSDCSFLVTSEGKNAPIYRVALPRQFGGCA